MICEVTTTTSLGQLQRAGCENIKVNVRTKREQRVVWSRGCCPAWATDHRLPNKRVRPRKLLENAGQREQGDVAEGGQLFTGMELRGLKYPWGFKKNLNASNPPEAL